jgi:UDP-glucose 6-dehydrogenase
MKIGIIGLGVVGSACRHGFELIGHSVNVHDIKMNTTIHDVLDTDVIYVCVPTPENVDGSCNVDAVEETVKEIKKQSSLCFNNIKKCIIFIIVLLDFDFGCVISAID